MSKYNNIEFWSNPNSGKNLNKAPGAPLFGTVKANADPMRSGRLMVYIEKISGPNPDDRNTWIMVDYMSPFYGMLGGTAPNTGYGTYKTNPISYGMWTAPPDVGTTVICLFVEGNINFGYWIGCVPKAEALYMVPAIGGSPVIIANDAEAASVGGAKILPVTNLNPNNPNIVNQTDFLDKARPIHSYVLETLNQQGLTRDDVRGVISSSAQRESPSRVGFGVSTPGRPIYKGGADDRTVQNDILNDDKDKTKIISRRAGHTFVMDDGDKFGKDQLIRLRTSLGHQILMSDDGQCLFVIHANGRSWIELGKEGTIDMYSTNSVNIRTQGDLNLHADRDININAAKDLKLKGENILIESDKSTAHRVGTDYSVYSLGNYTCKINGQLSLASDGDASFASGGISYVKGSKVNLNTGQSSLTPAEVSKIEQKVHSDTLYDAQKGWLGAEGKLVSVTSRAPAHMPWSLAGLGVDVSINNNAAAVLPSAPTVAVQQTNQNTSSQPSTPTTPAVIATVPNNTKPTYTLDKAQTGAVLSQAAVLASKGAGKDAVTNGTAVIQGANGPTAAVGSFAHSPEQLEQSGYIKPGSAKIVNKLVADGSTVEQALTPNLFTGKEGINNLNDYLNNTSAQVNAANANIQQSEKGLIQAGAITGKEAGTATGGLILSGANAGVQSTVDFMQTVTTNAASGAGTQIKNTLSNALGSVTNLVSGGKFAAGLSSLTGGLSGLQNSISSPSNLANRVIDVAASTRGLAAAAFDKIKNSLPVLKAGEPENLNKPKNENNSAQLQSSGVQTAASASSATNPFAGFSGQLTYGLPPISGTVTTGISAATSSVATAINSAKTNIESSAESAISASGINALAGGQGAVASIVTGSKSLVDKIPGLTPLKSLIDNFKSSVTSKINAISSQTQLLDTLKQGNSLVGELSNSLPPGQTSEVNSAISSLSTAGASVKPVTVSTETDTTGIEPKYLEDGIPPPIYNAQVNQDENKIIDLKIKAKIAYKDYEDQLAITDAIKKELDSAMTVLPAGSPQINDLKEKYRLQLLVTNEKFAKLQEASSEVDKYV